MLGELNGSHTGARYRSASSAPATASLGAFYDNKYTGDGLKIEEIIAKGPVTKADTKIKPGCIIEKIDGTNIKSGEDYYPLLSGKAGKQGTAGQHGGSFRLVSPNLAALARGVTPPRAPVTGCVRCYIFARAA